MQGLLGLSKPSNMRWCIWVGWGEGVGHRKGDDKETQRVRGEEDPRRRRRAWGRGVESGHQRICPPPMWPFQWGKVVSHRYQPHSYWSESPFYQNARFLKACSQVLRLPYPKSSLLPSVTKILQVMITFWRLSIRLCYSVHTVWAFRVKVSTLYSATNF